MENTTSSNQDTATVPSSAASASASASARQLPRRRRAGREPARVYRVHPSQFRRVVQRLTGAPPGSLPATGVGYSGGGEAQPTLGQMHEAYMAWVSSDSIVLSPGRGGGGGDGGAGAAAGSSEFDGLGDSPQ